MNGPVPYLKGKYSECHRVRNAKRPREGSNSRTVSNYYIDSLSCVECNGVKAANDNAERHALPDENGDDGDEHAALVHQ